MTSIAEWRSVSLERPDQRVEPWPPGGFVQQIDIANASYTAMVWGRDYAWERH